MISKQKLAPLVQVSLEVFFILSFVWIVERRTPGWFHDSYFWILCVLFPVFCIFHDQKSFPELSLDWEAFLRCLRLLVWFTIGGTVFLILLSFFFHSFNYDDQFLRRFSEYIFWAFLQQIGLQTFLTTRVHKFVRNPYRAALVSSSLFSLLHAPNPVLMTFSWVGGFFWALSFIQAPNLYALAVSHGWLAVVALHCVPKSWLHGLRIGPTYWSY